MGRGFPLVIAALWISSLVANAVTQANADVGKVPGRVALTHLQLLSESSPAAVAENPGRAGALMGPLPAVGSRSLNFSQLNAALHGERLLITVRALPRVTRTKSDPADPRKHARQHEHMAAHLMKASSPRPPAAGRPSHSLQVWVTGYDLYGITATGVPSGPGICAVDPYTIPLGTHITIAGVGSCTAADTGPAIIGAHIDVWVPDYWSAVNLTGYYTATW